MWILELLVTHNHSNIMINQSEISYVEIKFSSINQRLLSNINDKTLAKSKLLSNEDPR